MTDTAIEIPKPPSSASVQLAGWRLWLAWAVLAFILIFEIVPLLFAFPVYTAVLLEAEPPFEQIHVGASSWRNDTVVPRAGGVAEAAGMPRGRLIAVNGQPLSNDYTILKAARMVAGPIGESVELTVETDDGEMVTTSIVRTDTLPPEFEGIGMGYVTYTLLGDGLHFLTCLVFLLAALILMVRRRRGLVALIGAGALFWFAFYTPLWPMLTPRDSGRALVELPGVLSTFRDFAHLLAAFCVLLFIAVFPDGRVRPRWSLVPILLFLVLNSLWLWVPDSLQPFVGLFSVSVFVLIIFVSLAALVVRYRRYATSEQRQQTKWAVLGLAIAAGCLLIFFLAPLIPQSIGTSQFRLRQLGMDVIWAGTMFFPIGVTLSLLRYKLWDAEAAWSRSAMAGTLVLALTAIIAGGTALMQTALGASGPLAMVLATVAAAVLFIPLQNRLSDWADHHFLRDLTDLKVDLPHLVNHLRETESIEGIAEAVTDRVAPVVHATHASLVVPSDDRWITVGVEGIDKTTVDTWARSAGLSTAPSLPPRRRQPWRSVVWRMPGDRLFPVRIALRSERAGGELATDGWLLLGPRPDGSGYGPDDLEAVAAISGSVGRALQVVRVREARDAQKTAALAALGETLTDAISRIQADLDDLRTHPPAEPERS